MKSGCNLMRKGIKLLAAITAAAVVSTMSISAFGLSYETLTTYDTTNENVKVTTTVTLDADSEKDDEVAYLVYDVGEEPSSNTIKYIDQKNASGESTVTFEWTTTDLNINATAYVGSTDVAATAATPAGGNSVKLAGYDVTYYVEGKGIVVLDSDLSDDTVVKNEDIVETGTLSDTAVGVFHVFPEPGYVFDDVTGATATSSNDRVTQTIVFTADAKITFNFVAADSTSEASLVAAGTDKDETVEVGSVIKFAKATGAIKEAGILVAPDETAAAALTTSLASAKAASEAGIYVMKAWQVGSLGIYAVKVEDNKIVDGAEVAAYAVTTDGDFIVIQ